MSSDNPVKNLFAKILDKVSSPVVTDLVLPETRQGDPHYENRARYFIGRDGTYNGVNKENFRDHFNKDWKDKTSYDKGTNTGTGPTLQSTMRKFGES